MLADVGMCPATLLTDLVTTTGDDVRRTLDASQQAGAAGVSVWTPHFDLLGGVEPAAKWLSNAGLSVTAVEAAIAWGSGEPKAVRREAELIAAAAAAVGATRVVAVTMDPALEDFPKAQANLAVLVEQVSAAGAQVCVEFLPWSGIPSLAAAWELVEPLGIAAGLLLDTWHWQRQPGGPDPALLAKIPGDRIGYLQVCDAAPGDGCEMVEAMSARLLPGDGVVDFSAVWRLLDSIGARPFVATEIFNPALVGDMGALAFAHASIATARKVLDGALDGSGFSDGG
jgi:sugar phosphate isomerase/epimerase